MFLPLASWWGMTQSADSAAVVPESNPSTSRSGVSDRFNNGNPDDVFPGTKLLMLSDDADAGFPFPTPRSVLSGGGAGAGFADFFLSNFFLSFPDPDSSTGGGSIWDLNSLTMTQDSALPRATTAGWLVSAPNAFGFSLRSYAMALGVLDDESPPG